MTRVYLIAALLAILVGVVWALFQRTCCRPEVPLMLPTQVRV